eukprot:GEMP01091861.1.p1 GENE.GEMP01091861.1~~GEMP01091861.1.p1  ORF type:complete len:150 (+),score=25.35 GEMP01091861.1:127-576(+)
MVFSVIFEVLDAESPEGPEAKDVLRIVEANVTADDWARTELELNSTVMVLPLASSGYVRKPELAPRDPTDSTALLTRSSWMDEHVLSVRKVARRTKKVFVIPTDTSLADGGVDNFEYKCPYTFYGKLGMEAISTTAVNANPNNGAKIKT